MLNVTAGALVFPPAGTPGLSAYLTSKLAAVKTLEFLAAENPNVFVASVHPGIVDTGIFRKSGVKPGTFPMDSGEFYQFCLWRFVKSGVSFSCSRTSCLQSRRLPISSYFELCDADCAHCFFQLHCLHISCSGSPIPAQLSYVESWYGQIGMWRS